MLRARQKLGKYRIDRRLAQGGFATVYRAYDTVEGVRVALKIPHPHLLEKEMLESFRKEVRLTAQLDHPNILPIKNASYVDGHFVIVYPLGERTLAERLRSRISNKTALDYMEQMLEALAYAHRRRIIHCDIKPENIILFHGARLRLTDFGIAKVARHTVQASGSGTVGYMAPEQAMGKPSFRSDVFSLGLVLYRMFSGELPEWPYEPPLPGMQRLRRKLHPDLVEILLRALEVDPRRRYVNADRMLGAFRRVKRKARHFAAPPTRAKTNSVRRDWQEIRRRQFLRHYGRVLEVRGECPGCRGPVGEAMQACPWCGKRLRKYPGETRFPSRCPRCDRGMKLDWQYCPWCFGPALEADTSREYSDVRYEARCSNPRCSRKQLMRFMRYCPWCRRKVRKRWPVPGSREKCSGCGWGVLGEFWNFCAWCGKSLGRR